MVKYKINSKEDFIIEDYNNAKSFSSFLPGIAGKKGSPMWLFYVNRGQCVASFGIENKDGAMMEFYPANKSYQLTSNYGFRTFIKFEDGSLIEPFNEEKKYENGSEKLKIRSNEFEIEHINKKKGLKVRVLYYTIPNENFAGLIREVKIENIGDQKKTIEVLDGMPAILPYGVGNEGNKEMGNTLRAWMNVTNVEEKIPFYKLRGGLGDSAEVKMVQRGNFYLSYLKDENNKATLLDPIVDPKVVFGNNKSMSFPENFIKKGLKELLAEEQEQVKVNKVPSGFFGTKQTLKPKESIEMISLIGNTVDIADINNNVEKLLDLNFLKNKRLESTQLVEEITKNVEVKTADKMFDAYMKQNYLDNLLRGGYPILFEGKEKEHVYHIFSRKHGDLERDYNFFSLESGYYSQGNGNFRDVNQNRRSDILFNPKVGDFNVKMFMNLIQPNGYNPLVVKGCNFILDELKKDEILELVENKEEFEEFIKKAYTPGSFYGFIKEAKIKLKISENEVLKKMLKCSEQNFEAVYGEGFWIDHWTYNMDLVDSYLSVFPDKKEEFVFEKKEYMYYDSPVKIQKREQKYVLVDNKVRQYDAIDEENLEKKNLLESRKKQKNWVRIENGKGEIYKTNLYEKLLSLAVNKFGTMDYLGIGIEMEAGKPGWNDSLNGLPGLFGSGVSETFELRRILDFLLTQNESKIASMPIELHEFIKEIENELDRYVISKEENKDFEYWDKVSEARENYREKVNLGFSGIIKEKEVAELNLVLNKFIKKLEIGKERALEYGQGIYPTYMKFEATEYEMLKDEKGNQKYNIKGYPNVEIKSFEAKRLPYFLEGPTRAMKVLKNKKESKELYEKLKKSDIYDKKLKMYKTSESLLGESFEIGRGRAFTPGWLENESVFLHMEYKYMVSLLKAGLYKEFFEDIKTVFVSFMDPNVYGRSILENSSFIASSVNPDKSLHGQGFVARLSGATAESLEMRNIIMAGEKPFIMEENELILKFAPKLPKWLFDSNDEVSFKFLGKCNVTYHNEAKKDTYGAKKAEIVKIKIKGYKDIIGNKIKGELAEEIRKGNIDKVVVELK